MFRMERGWFAPLVIGVTTFMLTSVPAGRSPPPQPQVKLNNLKVLDGDGNPFPGEAGVVYCVGTDPCQAATTDQNGNVNPFFANSELGSRVFGFATNTGWVCGGYP